MMNQDNPKSSPRFERLNWCPEPTRGADTGHGARPASALWALATSGENKVGQLFKCLQRSYPHAVKLLDLSYSGATVGSQVAPMMQVHVLEVSMLIVHRVSSVTL